jgi:hypothetical protein
MPQRRASCARSIRIVGTQHPRPLHALCGTRRMSFRNPNSYSQTLAFVQSPFSKRLLRQQRAGFCPSINSR